MQPADRSYEIYHANGTPATRRHPRHRQALEDDGAVTGENSLLIVVPDSICNPPDTARYFDRDFFGANRSTLIVGVNTLLLYPASRGTSKRGRRTPMRRLSVDHHGQRLVFDEHQWRLFRAGDVLEKRLYFRVSFGRDGRGRDVQFFREEKVAGFEFVSR